MLIPLAHLAPLWDQYLDDCKSHNKQPMTFEAFREKEERIAADIIEKLKQKQNIGDIVNQLADQLTAEFKE
jgi:hypothetical protein